jgi:gas vesicle protein
MSAYTNNYFKGKLNEEVLEVTAGENESNKPYQSPDLSSGVMKEISKENSASKSCDIMNLLQYLIKEQNKALRNSITSITEELKEERKAFRKRIEANQIKFH